MLAILKLLQSIVRTLHSDGTPRQIAGGVALGAALGLTPPLTARRALDERLAALTRGPLTLPRLPSARLPGKALAAPASGVPRGP
ncbi:MAG TPA: hypothetical protein VNA89_14345 [Gemmatimonadaceae bacterium]|nr:hypothetical protein [Gemmatimonadaceae bacterium]